MGILTATTDSNDEKGLHIYKSCSTCLTNGGSAPGCYQGKFSRFSTINAKFGQTASPLAGVEVDENHCFAQCQTNGCDVDNVPTACAQLWGPSGQQNLQDPDAAFRVIAVRATRKSTGPDKVVVSVFIDGFHSSSQPPGYLYDATGITPPIITKFMLGVKAFASGGSPEYMSGDIAEMLIYNKALTVPEMDRVANYLARKFALSAVRLDDGFGSPTRSVPLSCTNCAGGGPVGEGGKSYDSHLALGDAYASGLLGTVTDSATLQIISATAAQADLVGALITVCSGACTAGATTAKGMATILTAGASTPFAITISPAIAGMTAATDGYFVVKKDSCAEDWGLVSAVTSPTAVTLSGVSTITGNGALVGTLLSVCAGICSRLTDSSRRISNLRGMARVTASTGLAVTLATPIPGVAVGDAYVLYNAHKVRLQLAINATGLPGLGGSANDNFYSFAGHYLYFRGGGRCEGRGTRIVSYSGASRCATLGNGFEVGDYLSDANAIAAADLAPDGACRGANCQGPDTGGMGGAAAGHVSSIKILAGTMAGCTTGFTLAVEGSTDFAAGISTVSGGGAITAIAIRNHGSGLQGGSFVMSHGSTVGTVTSTTVFVLATGSGSPTTANALVGRTIIVCNGICVISSLANLIAAAHGSSVITASTAGATPTVTVGTGITGVTLGDEYLLWGGPIPYPSDVACTCLGTAFNTPALAFKGLPCLRAIVGSWSDGQDGCAAGGSQDYVIVKDPDYKAVRASDYLAGRNTIVTAGTGNAGPTAGGTVFAARGAYLYPNDVRVSQAPSVTNVQLATGPDALLNGQYLRVTFGTACSTNPYSDRYCLRSRPEIDAAACTLYNFPRGYDPAGQALTTATDFSGIQDLPEIRCTAPAGAGAQRDVNIYWHGIPVTLAAWWHYMAPTVSGVVPSTGGYAGGETITVLGSNFGPQESWTTTSAGGLVRAEGVKAVVEIVGRSARACRSTQWVSDGQLVCVLPPLPSQKQAVDIAAHKVSVQVVVTVDQQDSTQGPASAFAYTGVPAYFACESAPPAASKESCFTCCRSACIVDSFAQGGAHGAATMGYCDTACYSYCRFF